MEDQKSVSLHILSSTIKGVASDTEKYFLLLDANSRNLHMLSERLKIQIQGKGLFF